MVTHEEKRTYSVYALTVAKSGLKLKTAEPPSVVTSDDDGVKRSIVTGHDGDSVLLDSPRSGAMRITKRDNIMHIEAASMTIPGFIRWITAFVSVAGRRDQRRG